MSLYAEYLRERTNDEIIETDKGFITWRVINERQVYIVDVFVRREFRREKVGTELVDEVLKMARRAGHKELIGTVSTSAKNATESIKTLLSYGMIFDSSTPEGLFFRKEI
jgi:GNAT superfamily N-acetyltransferase